MKIFIDKLKNKQDLSFDESKNAFEILMDGKASNDEIFDFLTLLSTKGETSDEIAGGVYVLRNKSKRVNIKDCSFAYFLSSRPNKFHCTVIIRCKHKTKIIFFNLFLNIFWL